MVTFLHSIPKVELHLHLEGAIPIPVLWELIKKYDGNKRLSNINSLKRKLQYRDFSQFIDTWIWIGKFIRSYEDYTFISEKVAGDLKMQNIRYAEVFYSPSRDSAKHLNPQRITEAITNGFNVHAPEIKINLIVDFIRDNGPDEAKILLTKIRDVKDLGIVGVGLGGSEHLFSLNTFTEVFRVAREYGFNTTAHAGEFGGIENIWIALNLLKVDRIGHCISAIKDKILMKYLKEIQIPIEMCPISNLKTGLIGKIEDHPIKKYFDKGLNVFVNTDDPKMFNNSMLDEYNLLKLKLNFTIDDIRKLIENAINAAWCSEVEKINLKEKLNKFLSKEIPLIIPETALLPRASNPNLRKLT